MVLPDFPRSLKELKDTEFVDRHLRTNWDPLESFFLTHGLTLWVLPPDHWPGSGTVTPPDERVRAPDGFTFRSPGDADRRYDFCLRSAFLCPARTTDGRDVIIRVVSIGEEGAHHRKALERLATGNIASVIGNHTVPVLQWLKLEDIVFAVFPLLSFMDPTVTFTFEDARDLLAHLHQMLEAVEFCHKRLVAHRDLFRHNFLSNFYGAGDVDASYNPPSPGRRVKPLRSLFPFMVYLIDFERSLCFDIDSDPGTHHATGRPVLYYDPKDPASYGFPAAPEMDRDEPHNPFRADIWQLGTYFSELKEDYTLPRPLLDLIRRMTAEVPSERPTAAEALETVHQMMSRLSIKELRAPVWKPPIDTAPESMTSDASQPVYRSD
ncbi:hypothetical protein AURDEDRAFT_180402 [Auricularia subglabra TFB-10046 SS5]|nr:hypothetical protein AURDEDRAFT_180402 [Auricularia subglabra TFB-10046 SS5]